MATLGLQKIRKELQRTSTDSVGERGSAAFWARQRPALFAFFVSVLFFVFNLRVILAQGPC